jgi:hypothetical protein
MKRAIAHRVIRISTDNEINEAVKPQRLLIAETNALIAMANSRRASQ